MHAAFNRFQGDGYKGFFCFAFHIDICKLKQIVFDGSMRAAEAAALTSLMSTDLRPELA